MYIKKISVVLLFLVVLSSCKKLDEFTEFDMAYTSEVKIPSSTGINLPFNIITPDVKTNTEATFEKYDTNEDLVEEIILSSMELELTEPSGADFSFLESIEVWIQADGLSDLKIAWDDQVSASVGSILVLNTSETDLKEYIFKDTYKLKVVTVTDELLANDHYIDVNTVFHVDAKILGI